MIVDEDARSVTFRLIKPDPEFLNKLASPELVVLPADTPRTVAAAPLPATGPYMVAGPFDAAGGLRLVRNPKFREWSNEAQPAGFAEEIVWRVAAEGEELDWPRRFRRGRCDVVERRLHDRADPGIEHAVHWPTRRLTQTQNVDAVHEYVPAPVRSG